MFGYFYNESMRRMTIAFGQLFNNIQIKRKDSSGSVIQSIRVPLAYAPKEKFLTRLDQQPDLDNREFAITLPRMSFEISTIEYDASRKLNRLQQVLPYFQPDYTVTVNAIPGLDIKRDVPIVLNSVNYEDSYNGDYTTRRAVIYTLTFTAKTYLFGPAQTQKVVKTVQSDLYSDVDRNNKAREERITIVPNPTSADADDDFGFTTTIESYTDGKKYNTTTDSDE